jgi:hypothetical protein
MALKKARPAAPVNSILCWIKKYKPGNFLTPRRENSAFMLNSGE